DVRDAVRDGKALVTARLGTAAERPVLRIGSRPGSVVAVSVVTPYEQLRYRVFLLVSRGQTASPAVIARLAHRVRYRVDFVVRAHGASPGDRAFLQRFGPATLATAAGLLPAAPPQRTGPAAGPNAAPPGELPGGLVIYRFDLSSAAARGVRVGSLTGTLDFSEGASPHHAIAFDLGRYR
nr:hypothetical protein [Candidatus Eremiobacteraeota bacterium]